MNKLGKSVFYLSSIFYNNDHYCTFIACHYNMRFEAVSWFPVEVRKMITSTYRITTSLFMPLHLQINIHTYLYTTDTRTYIYIFLYGCMHFESLYVSVPVRSRVCVCKYFKNCLIFDTSLRIPRDH